MTAAGVSSGSSVDVPVAGSLDPTGPSDTGEPTVEFTGIGFSRTDSVSATSVSSGSSVTLGVDGNLDPTGPSSNNEPEVTFGGDGFTRSVTKTGSGVAAGSSKSITVDGNLDPTGPSGNNKPEMAVTGREDSGSSVSSPDGAKKCFSHTSSEEYFACEIRIDDAPGEISRLDFNVDSQSTNVGPLLVDIYIVDETPDGAYQEGTLVKDNYDWTTSSGWANISLSQSVSTDGDVTVEVHPVYGDSNDNAVYLTSESGHSNYMSENGNLYDHALDVVGYSPPPSSLSVSTDSGTSVSFGSFSDGETKTKEFSISVSASSLNFEHSAGTVDYSLDMTERRWTVDPSVDIDGDGTAEEQYTGTLEPTQSVTKELEELSTLTSSATLTTSKGTADLDINWRERKGTVDPAVDIDGDSNADASFTGTLMDGERATVELAELSTSTSTATFTTSKGTADLAFRFKERQETTNPKAFVNGNELSVMGPLSDGQTVTRNGSTSWLSSGSNTVEIRVGESVGPDAPDPKVGITYQHSATDRINQTYTDERWSERYNVSKQFASDQSDVTVDLEHSGDILAVRSLEYSINGGAWQEMTASAYTLDGSTVHAEIGDVTAGDEVRVRDAASKVDVHNGSITVEEPTAPGERLDTAIRVDSWASDSYIGVDNPRAHYTANESWSASEYQVIKSDGTRRLYLPNAAQGSLARVRTLPVEPAPATGDVRVEVGDSVDLEEPELLLKPGPNGQGTDVDLTFTNAKSETDYILYSKTNGVVRDSGTANSPITLTDDDSSEWLQFQVDSSSSSSGGGGSGVGAVGPPAVSVSDPGLGHVGILAVVAGLIFAVWVLSRNFGKRRLSYRTLYISEGIVLVLLGMEALSGQSLIGAVGMGIARLLELVGMGVKEAAPLAILAFAVLAYMAIKRWGRPQVVVNRNLSLDTSVGGGKRGGGE
ncbi:hypothetical protein [Halosimplex amylolyticum]|uniref:hypothetical protein n=1 Tax=Halosimplex amylolyticum TaxID=3396616 RepID=UPI003F56317C